MNKIAFLLLVICLSVAGVSAQEDDLVFVSFEIEPDPFVEVELTLEPGAVSVLFSVQTESPDDAIYLVGIYDSDDYMIYEDANPDSVIAFGFEPFTDDYSGALGVFLPSSPANQLDDGTYYFVFEAEETAITDVTAIVRYDDVDLPQAIDINLWVLADVLYDDDEQERFAAELRLAMDAALNPHNLQVGEVRFYLADDAAYDEFAYPQISDEDLSRLNDICYAMNGAVPPGRALNVVLVEGFDEDAEVGSTAGISVNAGNAGIILDETSRHSCVVVSNESYEDDYANQAINILHEGAHFMSLPHTTEADGLVFDIFADTDECPYDVYDTNRDETVDDFECDVAGGASNVMFWSGEPEFAPFSFSDDQAWVLRRHPLFYSLDS